MHPLAGMNIYVAGRFTEPQPVRAMQRALKEAGASVTFDWTTYADANEPISAAAKLAMLPSEGELCLGGVRDAEVVVAVFTDTDPKYPYAGTIAELTSAIAMNRRVVRVVPPAVAAALISAAADASTPWSDVRPTLPSFASNPFWTLGGDRNVLATEVSGVIAAIMLHRWDSKMEARKAEWAAEWAAASPAHAAMTAAV